MHAGRQWEAMALVTFGLGTTTGTGWGSNRRAMGCNLLEITLRVATTLPIHKHQVRTLLSYAYFGKNLSVFIVFMVL